MGAQHSVVMMDTVPGAWSSPLCTEGSVRPQAELPHLPARPGRPCHTPVRTGETYVSSSFFISLERSFSLKLVRVTSPGYFRSSKFSSDTSWSSASEEAKEWAAGSDCKKPAGRGFNRWQAGRPPRAEGEDPSEQGPQRHVLESPIL